jgi:hypothetical protein
MLSCVQKEEELQKEGRYGDLLLMRAVWILMHGMLFLPVCDLAAPRE